MYVFFVCFFYMSLYYNFNYLTLLLIGSHIVFTRRRLLDISADVVDITIKMKTIVWKPWTTKSNANLQKQICIFSLAFITCNSPKILNDKKDISSFEIIRELDRFSRCNLFFVSWVWLICLMTSTLSWIIQFKPELKASYVFQWNKFESESESYSRTAFRSRLPRHWISAH